MQNLQLFLKKTKTPKKRKNNFAFNRAREVMRLKKKMRCHSSTPMFYSIIPMEILKNPYNIKKNRPTDHKKSKKKI